MAKVEAGRLTERVTLLSEGLALSDGRGGYTAASTRQERTVWARVEPIAAPAEKLYLGQVLNGNAYRVTIRTEPGEASAKQRLRWKGTEYGVQSATRSEAGDFTTLLILDSGQ